jgi:hypothetical protein
MEFGNCRSPHVAVRSRAAVTARGGAAVAASTPATILYDQTDADVGDAISAQDFGKDLENFDDMAADDFTVTIGEAWNVKGIDVVGAYWGLQEPGPADSVNVTFHADEADLPGTPVCSATIVPAVDDNGSFVLRLDPQLLLSPGTTYWLSLQANMDYWTRGQWGWEMRSVQGGEYPSKWQNPRNGFGTNCITWADTEACIPTAGVDYMFRLAGSVIACTSSMERAMPTR